jgi:hypothetical protein
VLPLHAETRVLLLAPEHLVHREEEGVVEHAGEEFLEDRRGLFDAWVGVDLNEPRVAVLIEHEVIAKHLKAKAAFLLVDFLPHAQSTDLNDGFNLVHKLVIVFAPDFEQILEVAKGQLVAQLVFTVVLVVFLHCVISEVDVQIPHLFLA